MNKLATKPIPSSTVIIIRQTSTVEVLLAKRNPILKSNGGAWVFPGGRFDKDDFNGGADESEAAKKAACRETLEETNIDLSMTNLTPYSHWVTPETVERRYATWFFIAEVNSDVPVTVDGGEIIEHQWLSPAHILQQHREGLLKITPPTFVTLVELVSYQSCSEALKYSAKRKDIVYRPKLAQSDETRIILYQEDVAYESCDLSLQGQQHRLYMRGRDWQYCALPDD